MAPQVVFYYAFIMHLQLKKIDVMWNYFYTSAYARRIVCMMETTEKLSTAPLDAR